jgi:oligopeptide transport system substrate-binding protein
VGNGQFTLASWHINKIITVRKNEYYWDAANVSLKEINFYPIENNLTEERAFRTGQLHITSGLPPRKSTGIKTTSLMNSASIPILAPTTI